MHKRTRIALIVTSLMLVLAYFLPIWKITLEAPQYPEGIGMYIWINNVTGVAEHDLANINGLNHYIGMQTIEPDSIPELKIMPWLIGFLIVFGLAAALSGRIWMMYSWIGFFLLLAIVGLVDFYTWLYDYGHNLNPSAAIKVPGMVYQPPLIGSKQLLNFTAHSWPAAGGWIVFLSPLIALGAAIRDRIHAGKLGRGATTAATAMLGLFLLGGCSTEPRPIEYGSDICEQCVMQISDPRFGTEVVLTTGRILTFDSIECIAAYAVEHPDLEVSGFWLTDFASRSLISAETATILQSTQIKSPMGGNLAAFGNEATDVNLVNAFGGQTFTWQQLLARAESGLIRSPADHMPEAHVQ